MKLRIVKQPNSPYKISNYSVETNVTKHDWYFKKDDTIEIDFDKIVYYMEDNFMNPHNIESEHDVRRIIESFLAAQLEGK
jgi:hypothetical protein